MVEKAAGKANAQHYGLFPALLFSRNHNVFIKIPLDNSFFQKINY